MSKSEQKNEPIRYPPSQKRLSYPYKTPKKSAIFYKFQAPVLHSFYTLAEKYFWFGSSEQLNDPHEFKAIPQENASDEEVVLCAKKLASIGEYDLIGGVENLVKIENNIDNEIETARNYWLDAIRFNLKKSGTKIFCASEKCSSPAMWAHYTMNHTGWAIGFRPEGIFEGITKNYWHKVIYQKRYPEFSVHDLLFNMEWNKKIFATKFDEWKYEKEWRCYHQEEFQKAPINTDGVEHIVFGLLCDKQTEFLVRKLTENWNIHYLKAIPSGSHYKIELIACDEHV